LRLRDRHAVEIELAIDPVLATAQAPDHDLGHARAPKAELIAARDHRVAQRAVQALIEHGQPVRAGEAGAGRATAGVARVAVVAERLYVAHRVPEQSAVVLVQLGLHATSAIGSSVYSRRVLRAPLKILVSNDDGFRAEGIRRLRMSLATL